MLIMMLNSHNDDELYAQSEIKQLESMTHAPSETHFVTLTFTSNEHKNGVRGGCGV